MAEDKDKTQKEAKFASAAAKKEAEERNVAPESLPQEGSGADGGFTKDDVVQAATSEERDLGPNGLPTDIQADASPEEVTAQIKSVVGGPDVPVKINPVLGSSTAVFPDFLGQGQRTFVRRDGQEADEYLSSIEWSGIRQDATNRDREGRQILIKGGGN